MKASTQNSTKLSFILFISLLSGYTFMCMTRNCFSSAMVFIVDEEILTKVQTGVITAAFYLTYAILQIVGGMVTDKLPPERFVTIGLLGASITNLVIFFSQNYVVMLISWSLNAALQFGAWPAIFKIVSTMLVRKMQTPALFVTTHASPGGTVAGFVVAAIVGTHWELNFIISAIGLAFFAILWEITVKIISPVAAVEELPKDAIPNDLQKRVSFGKMFITSGLVFVLVIAFIRTMLDFGIRGLTPTMINESYTGVNPSLATIISIIVLVAGVVGICCVYLVYPRLIKNESIGILILFASAFPFSIGMLWLGKISYWFIVTFLAFIVLFMGGCGLFTTSFIAARFNKYGKGSTVVGIINATASLGIVVAYTVFPAIAEKLSWNQTAILWIVLVCVALAAISALLPLWSRFLKNR